MNAIDPVCGIEVNPAEPKGGQANFSGLSYGFCGPACRKRFLEEPVRFAAMNLPQASIPARRKATYSCPMHPQIVRNTPSCPVCSMALEPSPP